MSLLEKMEKIAGNADTKFDHGLQRKAAEIARIQHEQYIMQQMRRPPQAPSSITIPLADFQRMQVQSGEELLTTLKVMLRMDGVEVADAEKITIELDLKSGNVKVNARQPATFHNYLPNPGIYKAAEIAYHEHASLMDMMIQSKRQVDAHRIDRECLEILKRGGTPEIIRYQDMPTMEERVVVREKRKVSAITNE